jgi:hypothetical protein
MKRLDILVLLLVTTPVFAQTTEPVLLEKIDSVWLLAYARQEDGVVLVNFSGVFKLVVEVDGERNLEVDPPTVWTASEGWKIKDVERPVVTQHGDGQRWRQTFILDPLTPAATSFELKPLSYRNGTGPWKTVGPWKPVTVKIVAHVSAKDLDSLRENPAIEDLPLEKPSGVAWEWPVAAGLGVLVLVLIVFLLRRQAVRRGRVKTLEETALYELQRLETLALPDRHRAGEFHTLLANVMRRYLEKRYQLPARRLTTQEFSALLEQTSLLTAEQKDFLRAFLQQCDLAKFADAQVPAQQCADLCRQTRDFLNSAAPASKNNSNHKAQR